MRHLIQFRVYPENKSLYFRVIIHPTWKGLRGAFKKAIASVEGARDTELRRMYKQDNFRAFTWSYQLVLGKRLLPELGEIHFYANDITPENISHEMLHAVTKWSARLGLTLQNDEERIARAVGVLVQQFYDRAIKRARRY